MTGYPVDNQTARVRGYNAWAWEEAWDMLLDLEIPSVSYPFIPGFVPAALEVFLFDAAGCIDSHITDVVDDHPLARVFRRQWELSLPDGKE